jgi:hypothetical protein
MGQAILSYCDKDGFALFCVVYRSRVVLHFLIVVLLLGSLVI